MAKQLAQGSFVVCKLVNGDSVFVTYHDNQLDNYPAAPTGNGTTDGWHRTLTSQSHWRSEKVAQSESLGTWGSPVPMMGQDGFPTPILSLSPAHTAVVKSSLGVLMPVKTSCQRVLHVNGQQEVIGVDPLINYAGRNLALNSKIDLTTNSYLIHTASLSEELQDGQEIAITVNGELPEGKSYYVATSPSSVELSLLPKTGVGQYSGTIKFRINPRYPNDVRNKLMFFNFPNDGNYPSVTNTIMVTKGNKQVEWVAAPEDSVITFNGAAYTAGSEVSIPPSATILSWELKQGDRVIDKETVPVVSDGNVDDIQIGGVNLIRYNNTAVNDAWVGFYSIVSVSPDKIIRGTSNVVTTGWPRIANNIGKYITAFDLTKQYTISFYARANDALNSLLAISDPSDSNKAYVTSLSLTSQWQYFSLTFIPLKQIVAATYLMIYCGKTGVPDTTSWVELKDVQLEQGNKATSWTPAVADVQFEIDAAQSAADAAIADLATINSDKIVSPPEKPALKAQWDMLLSEKASIDKSAELYLLTGSTEYQNYVTGSGKAIAAYAKYSNTAIKDIPITADYADISTYQNYKKAILNKIEEAIKAVQDAIKDQADKAQAVAEALNYLKAALKDGKVEVGSEGVNGVLLGNILGVVPPSQEGKYLLSNMRAGMSGIENDKLAFFAHPTDAYNTARKYVNGESTIRPNFAVTDQGQLIANDVDIKGKIEATIGVIGGFTINGSSIYSDNLTINNTFIRYKTSNNDRLVMFGTGTTPPSTAQNITARIENKVWANIASRSNVGLYVECSGIQNPYADSGRNIAIQAIGEVNITCPPTNGSRALIVNGITDLNNQLTVNGTTFINGELHVYGTVWFHNVPRQSTDRALYVNTGSGLIHRA